MKKSISCFVACLTLTASGCSAYLHSPPGRSIPLESVKVLDEGQTGVQAEIGGAGEVFAPGVVTASVRARRGFGKKVEASVEGNLIRIVPDELDGVTSDAHRGIYSARLGVKYELDRWIAFQAGLAGGGSAGGGFMSPDVGFIFAYENKYVTPFFNIGAYFSAPIAAKTVTFDDDGTPYADKPDMTLGVTGGPGIRVPLSHVDDGKVKSAFLFGARVVTATHKEAGERQTEAYTGGSIGLEIVLP